MALDGVAMASTFVPLGGVLGLFGGGVGRVLGANGVRIVEEAGLYRRTFSDWLPYRVPRLDPPDAGSANVGFLLGRVPGERTAVGWGNRLNYRRTFEAAYPGVDMSKIVVHHAIEKQTIEKRWPGMFDRYELNSLENLRGIPKEINNDLHLRQIRTLWNKLYDYYDKRPNMSPTRQTILDYVEHVDRELGYQFNPQELR